MRKVQIFLIAPLIAGFIVQPAIAATNTATSLLAYLKISEEYDSATYVRTAFKYWTDEDKNGCDTRKEVLILESRSKIRTGNSCAFDSGNWLSLYDNRTLTSPSHVDVDHLVPLKEAWESGASFWSSGERQSFANDLSFSGSLIAVSASANRSKGDRDPAAWMPSNKAFRCTYAVTWVQVKYRWSLTVDAAEAKALRAQLATCPQGKKYYLPSKYPLEIGSSEPILPSNGTPKQVVEGYPLKLISPGTFCAQSEAGEFGRSLLGLIYRCKTSVKDYRLRWRR